jgi:hypothetical protein
MPPEREKERERERERKRERERERRVNASVACKILIRMPERCMEHNTGG